MSEYKRLTKQVFDKVQGCEDKVTMNGQSLYDLYDSLAELEDKIESRKLVELEYKNGDYVFFISWLSGNVCEGTVVDWQEDSGYCIICGNDLISPIPGAPGFVLKTKPLPVCAITSPKPAPKLTSAICAI